MKRDDFPILSRPVSGQGLVYLDSAATTQKPRVVIDAVRQVYEQSYANANRGAHTLSGNASRIVERARAKVLRFLGAPRGYEVVFTRSTTDALNLVAHGIADEVGPGDEVLVTVAEHHANLLPWQRLAKTRGCQLGFLDIDDQGFFDPDELSRRIQPGTKALVMTHVSNVLGAIEPVEEMTRIARARGLLVVIDAAQSVPHLPIDLAALDADLLAFSAHKAYGPSGVGVLCGRQERLSRLSPPLLGGGCVDDVSLEGMILAPIPRRLEAGTLNLEGIAGLSAALDYISGIGHEALRRHESELLTRLLDGLRDLGGVQIFGPRHVAQRSGLVSFLLDGVDPHDAAAVLDARGIAVRAGQHCAQPLVERLSPQGATLRASVGLYNNANDIDALIEGLVMVRQVFGA